MRIVLSDRVLGLVAVVFSLVTLLVWIPVDVETGAIEVFRRQTMIGDALLPGAATVGIGLMGMVLVLRPGRPGGRQAGRHSGLDMSSLRFLGRLILVLVLALAIMRWLGPLIVSVTDVGGGSYRAVRDTAPWKYLGFAVGGWVLVASQLIWLAGRVRLSLLLLALAGVLTLMWLVDLPFGDLLLPPNGDV